MDLSTTYLGMTLETPLVASAGPLSGTLDGIRRLEDAGASAVVLFSLFEEQLLRENEAIDYLTAAGTESFGEALSYFPDVSDYRVGPDQYLSLIRRASQACKIPIIGSLNGVTSRGWTSYAKQIQDAGARGLELNIYYIPANLEMSGREVEDRYLDVVREVKSAVTIPVAVKMNPFFSAIGEMSKRFVDVGADGLVMFNRFYQPDFDLDQLEVEPNLELSSASEIRLPLMWIAILHGRLGCSLAATRGVESGTEVVKYLLAGADAVMSTSALLRHGAGYIKTLRDELEAWMNRRDYQSVAQMKGSMSQLKVANPEAFERANYIKVLESYKSPYMA